MEAVASWLMDQLSLDSMQSTTVVKLLQTVAILVGLNVARWLTLRVVFRQTEDVRVRYTWRKGIGYATALLGALLLAYVWFGLFDNLGTFLGLLSAGIAIALQDLLISFAGWVFILWRHPFHTGDRIRVGEHMGDVIDVRMFQFTLLETGTKGGSGQSTGRIIHLPNSSVFRQPIVNFTAGFPYIWNEVPVVVTFESDWRAAKEILVEIAQAHATHLSEDAERKVKAAAREYLIFYAKLTPTVYTTVTDFGVQLTLRYIEAPRRVRGSEQAIWEALLDALAARDDIDLAYPTYRTYFNATEGKPGARVDLPGLGPTDG
ncbi:MAG: mechanosensitive ion channel domain-containing protein [Bacteroidota bacterium]